jgi:hypothetical protein
MFVDVCFGESHFGFLMYVDVCFSLISRNPVRLAPGAEIRGIHPSCK